MTVPASIGSTRAPRPAANHQPSGRVDVESIKAQLDIVTLARSFPGTNLKQRGTVHRGGCPCCGANSKKEPFQVDPRPGDRQGPHFHCFSCGESGDVFNLFALQQYGSAHIPKEQFITTVRAAAQAYGVPTPEIAISRRRSPEQLLRAEVQTVWSCAHEYVRDQFLRLQGQSQRTAPEVGQGRPLGAASRLGMFEEGLSDHLAKLGVSEEARCRAGLTSEDLTAFKPGIVLLRTAGGAAVGFSQQSTSREWIHRAPVGTKFEPAFVSTRPSGRSTHRVLVLVSDVARAGRLAANLVALARDDEEQARRIATVGIVAAPADDPFDSEAFLRLSKRAVILAPGPDTSIRAIYEHGTRFLAAGIAVRVADATPQAAGTTPPENRAADAGVALDTWEAADDFFVWQSKQIPTVDQIEKWHAKRVPALLEIIPDTQMREVFAFRAASIMRDVLAQSSTSCSTVERTVRVSDATMPPTPISLPSTDIARSPVTREMSSATNPPHAREEDLETQRYNPAAPDSDVCSTLVDESPSMGG